MKSTRLEHSLRLILWSFAAVLAALIIGQAKILTELEARQIEEWQQQAVRPPAGAPPITPESISQAIAMFNIDIPATAEYPVLNKNLEDRGLSTRLNWRRKIRVEVGPSAFTSWGILGSTLAHELEIHCRQNFMLINLMDSLGLNGTGWAERQAYLYEIKNAKRFGLNDYQRDLINSTMAYYYDFDHAEVRTGMSARISKSIGQWLARSSVLDVQ